MTTNTPRLMVLPGDGVGPEVTRQARRVVEWIAERRDFDIEIAEGQVGYASQLRHGTGMTDEVRADAEAADAILFGAEGGPEYDALPREKRGPTGIGTLRKGLDLFANLRPVKVHPAMADRSSLKPEVIAGVDMIVLRELTSGIYYGRPRGIERLPDGQERGFNTLSYTSGEIERIARVAFELAAARRGIVHSVEKSNVMEVGRLWRRVVERVHEDGHGEVALHHLYVDNAAMQIVRWPKQFDVLVTGNMFGDILSDCAAMMFRYSFGRPEDADLIEAAVDDAVAGGAATPDIAGGGRAVSTEGMGDAVIAAMERRNG